MNKIFVTGAAGFVGQALSRRLLPTGKKVVAAVRSAPGRIHATEIVHVGDIGSSTVWGRALLGVDAVVHLAARVHDVAGHARLADYREVNSLGTIHLARAAAEAGVRRFVFLSSVKVNGETTRGLPFTADTAPNPRDFYAISKWEAEQALQRIASESGMDVVILRPPLVYGPNVKANFLRLLRWVDMGIPFPLGAVDNRRSMIYLRNLVDVLIACLEHPAAAGNTYLVSDGEDVSVPDLLRGIAAVMGKSVRLWNCPEKLLRLMAQCVGKSAEANRLLDSLQVDSSKIRRELSWTPPFSVQQGIQETVEWYMNANNP